MLMIIQSNLLCWRQHIILSLQESSTKLFKWFTENEMKSNADKYHLIVSTADTTEIQVGDSVIKNSTC